MASQIYLLYTNEAGNEESYELTCTSDVEISRKNKVSETPIEDGFNISDNSFSDPIKFSLGGVVTSIANPTLEFQKPPEEYIRGINSIIDDGGFFTLFISDNLDSYDNVVFEKFSLTKTSGQGDAWKASLKMKQIIVTQRAAAIDFPPQAPVSADQTEAVSSQSDNSTEEESLDTSIIIEQLETATGADFSGFADVDLAEVVVQGATAPIRVIGDAAARVVLGDEAVKAVTDAVEEFRETERPWYTNTNFF